MTQAPGPSRLLQGVKLLLQLLLTVVVTWFIMQAVGLNLEDLRSADLSGWDVSWGLVALASLVLLGAYLYSAALWGLMVRELGGPELGILVSLRVFFTANLGRYVPGKVWQIAGLALLAQREGVRPATATGAAVFGQGFSLAGATLVGGGVLLDSGWGPGFGGQGLVILLVLLLAGMTFPAALKGLVGLWFRLGKKDMPEEFHPGRAFGVRWMGLYALGWALQGLAFWILALGLGLELTVLQGAPAYAAAYVLGYVAVMAPAGLGIREMTLVVFLEPVLGAGVGALALVARLWTTVVELLPALTLAGGYLGNRKQGEDGSA